MKVGDVMARDVEFIDGAASLQEAAEMMGELDVGALPVGSSDQLEGVVTDRDILYRYVAKGLAANSVLVRDVMTSPVVSCDQDDTLRAAMDAMAANHSDSARRCVQQRRSGRRGMRQAAPRPMLRFPPCRRRPNEATLRRVARSAHRARRLAARMP